MRNAPVRDELERFVYYIVTFKTLSSKKNALFSPNNGIKC